jgi:hypothetical protein
MNYEKIYNQIIDRAKTRQLEGYKEKHHILPKCMGGSNGRENIVILTAREHFVCHWLLCRIYPEHPKLAHAFWFMSKQNAPGQQRDYTVSSRVYAEAVSNLKFTEEHKRKMSISKIGNKNNKSRVFKGMKSDMTKEGRRKLSEAISKRNIGRKFAAKGPYTVTFQTGVVLTADSYPDLSKLTNIPFITLQWRFVHKKGVFIKGWKIE